MSQNLKLDPTTHDIVVTDKTERHTGVPYVLQLAKTRLLTLLSEWELDPTLGLPWMQGSQYDVAAIQGMVADTINSTNGVQALIDISVSRDQRVLAISFTARTIYGTGGTTLTTGAF